MKKIELLQMEYIMRTIMVEKDISLDEKIEKINQTFSQVYSSNVSSPSNKLNDHRSVFNEHDSLAVLVKLQSHIQPSFVHLGADDFAGYKFTAELINTTCRECKITPHDFKQFIFSKGWIRKQSRKFSLVTYDINKKSNRYYVISKDAFIFIDTNIINSN